jgi:hypothetical protein
VLGTQVTADACMPLLAPARSQMRKPRSYPLMITLLLPVGRYRGSAGELELRLSPSECPDSGLAIVSVHALLLGVLCVWWRFVIFYTVA